MLSNSAAKSIAGNDKTRWTSNCSSPSDSCSQKSCNQQQHKVISARQASEIIAKADDHVLILDCRSFIEFNASHIKKSLNVCCSKLMKRRLQQDKMTIRDLLLQSCRVDSNNIHTVLIYDQNTEQPAKLPADSFLVILMAKMLLSFNSVYFLRGGFMHFRNSFSSLVESNSAVAPLLTDVDQISQSNSTDSPPTRVLSFLYLGSQVDAMNKEFMESHKISYVLNVSAHCTQSPFVTESNFLRIPINDTYNAKIVPHLEEAFKFLDKVRESGGCVLVHCLAGISRSPTMAIAYLMHSLRLSYEEAYQYVRERRPTIAPNFNFLGQLLEYEKSINENRRRSHKRQQSLTSIHSSKTFTPPSTVPHHRVIHQVWRPHSSTLPKRPSLTGLAEFVEQEERSQWSMVTFYGDSDQLSEKQPRLDSPTSAMARLSFDRSVSVEVRLQTNFEENINDGECATPKNSNPSPDLASLLAKAAVASSNLSSLPLRACKVDARLSSALSSAQHRAITCAAVGSAGGLSMPSFDNLLVASCFSSSPTNNSSSVVEISSESAEAMAAWRKTRSLDNMAMLDPLIESSGDRSTTPTAATPNKNNGNSEMNNVAGPVWAMRAASATLPEQTSTSKSGSGNGMNAGGSSLLCGSGTVSPASSSLSLHSVCSSTTEIAA